MAATAYVIILGILVAWRFESGRWRKIDLLGNQRGRQGDGESGRQAGNEPAA
jgi:hypothetical protein